MAILRVKDVRKLGEKELRDKLDELKLELSKERANIAIGASASSPGKIREIRRAIARIKTAQKELKTGGKSQ